MFHSQLGWTHHLACQLAASFISPQGCDRQIILGSLHEIRRQWEQDAPFRSLQLVCLPQLIQRRFAEELSLRFKIILLLEEINFKKLRSYYSFPELLILHSVLFPWLINTGWPLGHGLFFFLDFIYLFSERGEGRDNEGKKNTNVWLPLTCPLNWGPGPQPRHVPWVGIELATLWFAGRRSVHWGTPAKATLTIPRDNSGLPLHMQRTRVGEVTGPDSQFSTLTFLKAVGKETMNINCAVEGHLVRNG